MTLCLYDIDNLVVLLENLDMMCTCAPTRVFDMTREKEYLVIVMHYTVMLRDNGLCF